MKDVKSLTFTAIQTINVYSLSMKFTRTRLPIITIWHLQTTNKWWIASRLVKQKSLRLESSKWNTSLKDNFLNNFLMLLLLNFKQLLRLRISIRVFHLNQIKWKTIVYLKKLIPCKMMLIWMDLNTCTQMSLNLNWGGNWKLWYKRIRISCSDT